jgi:hypothetical protein
MTFAVCRRCRHKIFSLFYTPKFCRECGRDSLKYYSFLEWLILAAVATLIVKYLFEV